MEALSKLKRVALVVQKEDFLRNDTQESKVYFKRRVAGQYRELTGWKSDDFLECYPGIQDGMPGHNDAMQSWLLSYKGPHIVDDAVRCLGFKRETGEHATPVMHHKFLVLGNYSDSIYMRPRCVITGSFNWSKNAETSRENIVIIEDERIAQDYFSEWAQLWSLSEPLDWTSPCPAPPTHYIGT